MTVSQTSQGSVQETEAVAQRWFDAQSRCDGVGALTCFADNVVRENSPALPEFGTVIRWLSIFRRRAELAESLRIWSELPHQLLDTFIKGREVLAIVHEVALVRPTGRPYDIEFIQRIKIGDDRIARWKLYWDATHGLAAFGAWRECPAR